MRISVTTDAGQIFNITVDAAATLGAAKFKCRRHLGAARDENLALFLDGRQLANDGKKLRDLGVRNGDMLFLRRAGGVFGAVPFPFPGASMSDPAVAGASGSPRSSLGNRPTLFPFNNPFATASNPDMPDLSPAMAEILQDERQKNIDENLQLALEFAPEFYAPVPMLFLNVGVNGEILKAIVDSGAQMTMISATAVKKCRVQNLIDPRWMGVAQGVGSCRILGRIHLCELQIGEDFLPASMSVLELQPIEMLLGLDMLRRHQCTIDLKTNHLSIGSTGHSATFLSEREFPSFMRTAVTQ